MAGYGRPSFGGGLCGWALVFVCGALPAQELIAPGSELEREAIDTFARAAAAPELPCSVRKYGPRLSFALRYWTGYEVTIAARNLRALPGARLQVLLRATPRVGAPRYFSQLRPMPELPADPRALKRIDLFLSGGLAMGAGDYELSLHVSDASDRVCRSTWRVTAPVAKVPLRLEAGEVADAHTDRWRGIPAKHSSGLVTVFLHAAPVVPRRTLTRLSPWDSAVLLGSLTSLLDTLPFPRARVVAYNLDSREILFRDPHFGPEGLARLAERLDNLNLGLISAYALKRASPADVLREAIEAELSNPDKADALIFLGPLSRYFGKAPPEWKRYSEVLPATYGVAVFPRFGQTGDLIQSLVKAAGGQTVMVYQPADLARAVREITKVDSN